jgi:hypothetical protein
MLGPRRRPRINESAAVATLSAGAECPPGNIGRLFNHLRIPPWVLPLKLLGFIRCVPKITVACHAASH